MPGNKGARLVKGTASEITSPICAEKSARREYQGPHGKWAEVQSEQRFVPHGEGAIPGFFMKKLHDRS